MLKNKEKRISSFLRQFNSLELLTFAYALLSAIYILCFYRKIENPSELLLTRVVFFIWILGLSSWNKRHKSRILDFVRLVFPLALITYWYPETYYLNHDVLIPNLDPFFERIELQLFSCNPAMSFSRLVPYAWFSELMYFSYFSYFLIYIYIGCLFFFKYPEKLYPVIFSVLMSFFVFYIVFIFLPVQGPQFFWSYPDNKVPDGYFFCKLMRFTQSMGEKPTGAFPSSHVGMTLIYMWIFYKHNRKSFWLILPLACLLIMSTVYIKAHYLIDVIGGFIAAPIIYWLSRKIYDVLKRHFPQLDEKPMLPHIKKPKMKIDVCLSPALFPHYNSDKNSIVVVIDVLRATTCICVGFENNVRSIIPIASTDEAKTYQVKGYIVAAERDAKKCDFADIGNSPFDYMNPELKGKDIVITTTNGTQAIELAKMNDELLIGAFANFSTLSDYLLHQKKDVLLLCAGWNNRVNLEDTLFAGALAEKLMESGNFSVSSDAIFIATSLWKEAKNDINSYLHQAEHVQRLLLQNLQKDIHYCLTFDTTHTLPYYDKESGVLKNKF